MLVRRVVNSGEYKKAHPPPTESKSEYGICNGHTIHAVVAGTSFNDRAETIRDFIKKEMTVTLRREPDNEHDSNAIEVLIPTGILGGLEQVWFIKKRRAKSLAKLMDNGVIIKAKVDSFYAPKKMYHPRVSLLICIEDN